MIEQIKNLKEGRVCTSGMIETIRDKKNIQFIIQINYYIFNLFDHYIIY